MGNSNLPNGKTNLDIFASTLIELATLDREVLVVTSDSRGSGRVTPFADKFPEQIVEIGIAEQNLVGVSAGLASVGKKVFVVSPACFLTARALEQIKNDVAYSDHPVKVIGISAGVSYGSLGTTHHSLHDFAVLQAINNIDIVAPADNFETIEVIRAAIHHPRPIYIRFGKKVMPNLHTADVNFEIGKAIQLTQEREKYDIALIAIGETVTPSNLASQILGQKGITSCVLSLHSLRPFDEEAVSQATERSKVVITVEEHSVNGGLGSRVASFLMQVGIFRPLRIVGIPDEHTITGSQTEIFNHYGISADGISQIALDILEKGS
ncbi:transketolase C-terminal domain-containing protein [Candidatus Villigracilis affinis]|uniref:transketolase family protein n=1 Tax=Candidatus Villigracilis affinis TaxID=3140682 RepID=UPI001D49C0DC|nr:transketolase family protein [Anaerolineales bacterium]